MLSVVCGPVGRIESTPTDCVPQGFAPLASQISGCRQSRCVMGRPEEFVSLYASQVGAGADR
jgi:hypothetical protein